MTSYTRNTTRCDGPRCTNFLVSERDGVEGREADFTGWITMVEDSKGAARIGAEIHFCGWACLVSFAARERGARA